MQKYDLDRLKAAGTLVGFEFLEEYPSKYKDPKIKREYKSYGVIFIKTKHVRTSIFVRNSSQTRESIIPKGALKRNLDMSNADTESKFYFN